jgi:hypothetical protein
VAWPVTEKPKHFSVCLVAHLFSNQVASTATIQRVSSALRIEGVLRATKGTNTNGTLLIRGIFGDDQHLLLTTRRVMDTNHDMLIVLKLRRQGYG